MNSTVTYLKIKQVSFIDCMQGFSLEYYFKFTNFHFDHRKVYILKCVAS